jgi:hypothetical protein
VAEYLRAGGQEKPQSEKLLEKLSLPTVATPSPASTTTPVAGSKVDEQKLAALAKAGSPSTASENPPASNKPEPAVDLAKAEEKLSSLLGNKK